MGFHYDGGVRPPFAQTPADGQESVWDYPRPPRVAPDRREILVIAGGTTIARTSRAVRILETASPPTVYLPPGDVRMDLLTRTEGRSFCEWKGSAVYWNVLLPGAGPIERAGWSYPQPMPPFDAIRDYVSFYPGRLACFIGGVRVAPQPGGFYGGWLTPEIVGPVKGEPGTEGW